MRFRKLFSISISVIIIFRIILYCSAIYSYPLNWTNDIPAATNTNVQYSPAITVFTSFYIDWIDLRDGNQGSSYYKTANRDGA
ncbi:MAG TPA: hypothetical protein PKY81_01815 [bacterium]|nr:hypothetical protein [bacterium]